MEHIMNKEITETAQTAVDVSEPSYTVSPVKAPTGWDEFVTYPLPMFLFIAALVGLVYFGLPPINRYFDRAEHDHSRAVSPTEFNQGFFTWSYANGQGLEFACNHSGGVVWLEDGKCHDSEAVRTP